MIKVEKSLLQKWDETLWQDGPFSRREKALNHLKPAVAGYETAFIYWRIVAFLISAAFWVLVAIYDMNRYGMFSLWFLTVWGIWLTTLNFILLTVGHITQARTLKKANGKSNLVIIDSSNPFHLWKMSSYISQMALVYEVLITLVYWCLLYEKEECDTVTAL